MSLIPISNSIKNLYIKDGRDIFLFELKDAEGIQVVRRYKNQDIIQDNKVMFITVYLKKGAVHGSVSCVVYDPNDENLRWTMVAPSSVIFQRPTSYDFGRGDDIHFDPIKKVINFESIEYSVNDFIDLLELNHLRDMFFWSRLAALVKTSLLHILFFLADSKYDKMKVLIRRSEGISNIKEVDEGPKVKQPDDPLFKYFRIYKNFFGFIVFILLFPLSILSICLNAAYFTISNPFLLFLSLLLFYIMEKLSGLLEHALSRTNFVQSITKQTFQLKGRVKHLL
ncbi:MAG: hypothetical protein KBD47_03260 [Candidatus Pacebacteria bacterium]|nr:hypothetical protein [Candidatus Paceibacterota bacterium]